MWCQEFGTPEHGGGGACPRPLFLAPVFLKKLTSTHPGNETNLIDLQS
jgi:hypothetical protein